MSTGRRLAPWLLLLAGCVAPDGPGVSVRYVELEGRWAGFEVVNESSTPWSYQGHGPQGLLASTRVEHLEGDDWESCLTALGCGTDLETYTLAPGDRIRLRVLLDEPLPTRLGLPLHGAGASGVAWSDAVDPRALGLYGDEVGGAEAE